MLGLSEGEVAFAAQIRDFHPDWAYRLVTEEGLPQAIENGSWAGETALLGRDGREIPVSQVLMSHKGADGTLEYLSTIVRDLTERKQAEDALQMFQFCLDHAPDAVFWINRDGSYGYVNERACESLGYNREELLNLRLWDIDPDMSRERMLERWAAFRKDTIGSQHFESRHRRKDGKVFPVDVLTCHFWFGGKEFHVAFVRDITERKAAETALRESETRFRELAEMLPQTVFEIDATGRFTFANHAGLETFGYSREELTDLDARAFFAPADRNRITENIQKRLQDEPVINREYQALRKDGQTFPILLYASPIFRDGVPVGLRGIGLDISEQKRVEEERQARLVALESMERINGIIREATDPEQMIADVIQAVRTIFDCDRAWLLYPCDPDAPSFRVAVESTHPDYPGGHAHDLEIPITPPRAQRIRDALASQEPLSQIVDADHHDPAEAEVQFGMQSELTIAVFPKVGKPWTFGLHQCSYPRRWTSDERRLFKEISHRMADGLSSLMSLRHLRESETRFRELAEMLPQTVFEMDTNGHFTFTNHAALDTFGYSLAEFEGLAAQQLFAPEDRDRITENIQKRLRNEPVANREYQALRKDGQTFPILLYASPILRGDVPAGLRGIGLDITERKQAEEERQARLYALESMERINGIIREATDPEQMLRDVTEMVRSVFNCDRVWLLYPCDPDAPSFHVPVESTSPDCPGLGEVNTETPVTAGLVHSMRELLASAVPLPYVAGTERCVSPELADPFTIQSQLAIAVYPKVGKPWIFGLHQCSHPRLWTNEEQRLFKEISHRMADGLSSLLSLRNLKESETRFRELAELLPQTVLETDAEGRLSFANRLAYDLFGYRPDDLPALRLPDLFVADERPRLSESLRRQLKGEASWDHEFTAQRQDGSTFPVLLYSAPIVRDGVTVGLRGVVVDITERQHAEQALQESKAKLESIFESSPHAICVGDLEGIIVDCNQAMLDMHEFKTKDELLGRSVFNVVAESDLPWARKHLEKTLNEGRCKDIKVTLLKRDGQTFPSEASASLMRDATGQPMGLVATIADITERKRLEQALERRLVALTRPLSDTTGVEFEGLFDLGEIQTLQDLFADATGVASIITRPDGTPLTKPSNFCRLCATIIRQTPDGLKNCYYSDSVIGRHNPSGPVVQPCLSGGLWDAGASITVGGKHIANWLIGQVRNQAQDEAKMRQYARHIGADVDTFMEAYHEVPTMSEEKFERIADALYAIAERLSTTAYQNVQQARFISERRRAQEELAHERNLLRTLIDNLPDSTYVKDRDSRFLLCSRQTILAAGVEGADQVIGKTDFDFYPSETATAFFQEEQRLMQSGQSLLNVERRFTDPVTHEVVWDLTTKVPLRDAGGQVVGLVGTSKDITALKQSQEALRESLQTSSDIVASIPSGLLLYKYSPPDNRCKPPPTSWPPSRRACSCTSTARRIS